MMAVRVELAGGRGYDILIGGSLRDAGRAIRERVGAASAMVVTSPRVGGLYFDPLASGLGRAGFVSVGRHDVPDGEEHKSLDEWRRAVEALAHFAPEDAAAPVVVALGGGVVGDLAGFVAATFRRGVALVQVPTTLLACVDSSVGGKTGVDLLGVKNYVGAFHQPGMVFMDLTTLRTLDPREVRSGVAEVVKCGAVLSADLFSFLEERIEDLVALDMGVVERVVKESCEIKAAVVGEDERDTAGKRIVLNFGHTVGHAVEAASGYSLLHGEAVAVGMVAAARIAVDLSLCDGECLSRLVRLVERAGLPTTAGRLVSGLGADDVLAVMRRDKKFVTGRNRFVLPTGVGSWTAREGVPEDLVRRAVAEAVGA